MPPRHTLISSVKDEGPFLLEWVAHHLVLGFDRILIASNDCSDGTDRLLSALAAEGYITHVPNKLKPGEIPQHAGYEKIRRLHDIDASAWLMMLDADEFLNVHVGDHRVADLTERAEADIDVIALNGMFFTSQPVAQWQPGRVCPLFTQRLPIHHKANAALKTLTRNPARFRGIHNHSMVGFKEKAPLQVLWGDGTRTQTDPALPLWRQLRNGDIKAVSHRLAHYNHYGLKAPDSFALRRSRGRGAVAETNAETARHTDAYFFERDQPAGEDLSIARYSAEVQALMAEMLQHQRIKRRQRVCEETYDSLIAPYRR
ncbi:glycosyltransferase family 2 protein [Cypionkella sp.]|uniref:glycosyltransferase family 2 protein n=1 Tax=Cypionkella sp. TaxID=2811411 RepID=UPI002ABCC592|nr:glycosyltransferase family 2 protein [Cypionkella sp.]MDZ4391345.1 glycosyltransferase family 2 protein [Cypionkella sp.]